MPKSVTLLHLGLWPSTPVNPVTAIDIRFMELMRCQLLEGGVAVYRQAAIFRMFAERIPNLGYKV